jgi:hypothetical protein
MNVDGDFDLLAEPGQDGHQTVDGEAAKLRRIPPAKAASQLGLI